MFYLHLLTGLISSNKYWTVAKQIVPVLKGKIQVKFDIYEIITKTQTKQERLNFLKT